VTGVEDDSANGSWIKWGPTVNSGGITGALTAWYFPNSVAATPVVTATFASSVGVSSIACGSYSDLATSSSFDVGAGQGQQNQGTGSDAQVTGPTASTAGNNELAVSFTITQTGVTVTKGTAWTTQRLNTGLSTQYVVQVQDMNVATPATVEGKWTFSSAGADHLSIVGTFKEPGAETPSKKLMLMGVGEW
jgi:hypothetical protein